MAYDRWIWCGPTLTRRKFVSGTAASLGAGAVALRGFPAIAKSGRPAITHGVQSGDVGQSGAVIWSRTDRPARMIVDYATTESFQDGRRIVGPAALADSDFTAKVALADLPAGQDIVYRVQFQDLSDLKSLSEPVQGGLRTAPSTKRTISFVWSGDTAGQGWGINPEWGGMRCYETMRRNDPDFFIHSGDTVYADGPIEAEVPLPDGGIWKNLTTEEKSKVAETLQEFRGQYKYNLMDENVRRFNANVPMFAQWDDHETINNWYPGEILDSDQYKVKSAALLAARANRAFCEFMPLGRHVRDPERIYRTIHYGPLLDIFFLDMRSYRGANDHNRETTPGPDTAFLGSDQIAWLKEQLANSRATWKVIASDMPIGLIVRDGEQAFENAANGDGPVLGREFEIADILRFIARNGVKNVVWLTADVHYTAAHYYDPNAAQFSDFRPFWEFVSGPVHAGSFGPNELDNTFGPQVRYQKSPEGQRNVPPTAGLQFFGHVRIDGGTDVMTVTLKDLEDTKLFSVDLTPET